MWQKRLHRAISLSGCGRSAGPSDPLAPAALTRGKIAAKRVCGFGSRLHGLPPAIPGAIRHGAAHGPGNIYFTTLDIEMPFFRHRGVITKCFSTNSEKTNGCVPMRDRLRFWTEEDVARHGEGRVLILGSPRSGTTWLAKLFDSHPDVLYRHEPDMTCRPDCLPKSISPSEDDAYIETARAYLDVLARVRTLRTTGSLPVMMKRHRSSLGRVLRTGLILGVRGLEMATRNNPRLSRIQIPDLISRRPPHPPRIVIKSVNLLAYVRLFAKAWPGGKVVIIVRHPCGQVESVMRGVELGVMPSLKLDEHTAKLSDASAKSKQAERLGLRVEKYSTLSMPEQMAWQWAYQNQRALHNIDGSNNIKLVLYEELAADPIGTARDLFDFAGLSWEAQVERFIRDSTRHHASHYYSVKRKPSHAANRWRKALPVEDQQRIAAIASRVPIGRAFSLPMLDQAASSHLKSPVPVSSGPDSRGGRPSLRPAARGWRSPATPREAAAKRP